MDKKFTYINGILDFLQQSTPSVPLAGHSKLYFQPDGELYTINNTTGATRVATKSYVDQQAIGNTMPVSPTGNTFLSYNDDINLEFPTYVAKYGVFSRARYVTGGRIVATAPGGTLFQSYDDGASWNIMQLDPGTPGYNKNTTTFAFSDAYNGWVNISGGLLYYTSNSGWTWRAIARSINNATVSMISFPTSSTGYAIGGGGYISKTTDGGKTWSLLNSGTTSSLTGVHFIDANTGWVVGPVGVVLKTTNGGSSWTTQTLTAETNAMGHVQFVDANNGWTTSQFLSGAWRTTDGGTTWTKYSHANNDIGDMFFIDSLNGFILRRNGPQMSVTTDGGLTWSGKGFPASGPNAGNTSSRFAVKDVNNFVVFANNDIIAKTTDGGTTFTFYPNNSYRYSYTGDIWQLSPTDLIACTDCRRYRRSIDGGKTWTENRSYGSDTPTTPIFYFVDSLNGFSFSSGMGVDVTTDGGITWTYRTAVNAAGVIYDFKMINTLTGWACGSSGKIIKTTDGWATYATQTSGVSTALNSIWFTDANHGWCVGNSNVVLYTVDGGTTWQSVPTPPVFSDSQAVNSVCFIDNNIGWIVGANPRVYKTTDGGMTWASQTSNFSGWGGTVTNVLFTDANHGIITGQGGIAFTSNGGTFWRVLNLTYHWLTGLTYTRPRAYNANTYCFGLNSNGFTRLTIGPQRAQTSVISSPYSANLPAVAYGSGTAYTLTNSYSQVTFGTSSPTLALGMAGTYLIKARVIVTLAGATFASSANVNLQLRAGTGGSTIISNTITLKTGVQTTADLTLATLTFPEIMRTSTVSLEPISIWAYVNLLPSAGSVQITDASISYVPISQNVN